MTPRTFLAAGLALALSGCTLSDGRDEVAVLPPFDLVAGDFLHLEIRASAGARASIRVDGNDRGSFQVNVPISLDTSHMPDGPHALRVTVLDGPYSERSIERSFLVDRNPPTCQALGPSPVPPGADLVVTVVYSEPVDPGSVAINVTFFSRGIALPTRAVLSADGRTVTATLLVPLEDYPSVGLRTNVSDLAGNPTLSSMDCFGEWAVPISPLTVTAPAEVEDRKSTRLNSSHSAKSRMPSSA